MRLTKVLACNGGFAKCPCGFKVRCRSSEVFHVCAVPRAAGWGDNVAWALGLVGITERRVSSWLGRKCNCGKRRRWLNRLGRRVGNLLSRR